MIYINTVTSKNLRYWRSRTAIEQQRTQLRWFELSITCL